MSSTTNETTGAVSTPKEVANKKPQVSERSINIYITTLAALAIVITLLGFIGIYELVVIARDFSALVFMGVVTTMILSMKVMGMPPLKLGKGIEFVYGTNLALSLIPVLPPALMGVLGAVFESIALADLTSRKQKVFNYSIFAVAGLGSALSWHLIGLLLPVDTYPIISPVLSWLGSATVFNLTNVLLMAILMYFLHNLRPFLSSVAFSIPTEILSIAITSGIFYMGFSMMGLLITPLVLLPVLVNGYAYSLVKKERDGLETAVEKRTAELSSSLSRERAVIQKLTELDKLKSDFLASMSHELRTPLNSIIGFSDLILWEFDVGRIENPEMEIDVGRIKHNGTHLLNLIDQILDMAKIESGKVEMSLRPAKPSYVAQVGADLITGALGTKQLFCRIDEEMPQVQVDETRMNQVLLNLLSNAVKFSESKIILSTYADDSFVYFSVKDDGSGIKEEDIPVLWDKFGQVKGTKGGTGLGLPISKELITLMGGDLYVESTYGQGSDFIIKLPIADEAAIEQQAMTAIPQ